MLHFRATCLLGSGLSQTLPGRHCFIWTRLWKRFLLCDVSFIEKSSMCLAGIGGIYTRVSSYIDWIIQTSAGDVLGLVD